MKVQQQRYIYTISYFVYLAKCASGQLCCTA